MTYASMILSFILQNLAEIEQSAADLTPKTIFNMAPIRNLELKNFCFYYRSCD